ncbi:MAG: family 4 glycosyl hydrolase [bacterium]
MGKTKIIVIGAASASFGLGTLADAFQSSELRGSKLALVDIDGENLEVMAKLAHRLNEESGMEFEIQHTTDRREALPGAEFVITSIAIKRNELWKLDFQIPLKYGIKQVLGENGGPGGLFHSLRNIPIILDICWDMEKLCPKALLLNFSNPESRICLAVSRHTKIKSVGLCHGLPWQLGKLARLLGLEVRGGKPKRGVEDEELLIEEYDIDGRAAGLNHFTWITELRRKSTGEDLYPLLRRKVKEAPDFQPLCAELFWDFGLYPSPSDDHVGEYISYAWERCGLRGYDFDAADRYREEQWNWIRRMASGEEPVDSLLKRRSGEIAMDIIVDIVDDRHREEIAVNIPNDGFIANLEPGAIVEVAAVVDRGGVHGVRVGELPRGIAALCNTQIAVQDLVVEAAVTGSRQAALQSMLIDPVVQSADAARKTLDELLKIHAPYLPQFK